MKLREIAPHEFMGYHDTRAFALRDVEVVREHRHLVDSPFTPWPGRERNVFVWWELADGHQVGWNENPSRGWSFPVRGGRTK